MGDCPCAKRRPKTNSPDQSSLKPSVSVTIPSALQPEVRRISSSDDSSHQNLPPQRPTSGRVYFLQTVPEENKEPRAAAVGYRHLFANLRSTENMEAHKNYRKVSHCIFDMDGLMLDTEKLYTQATQSILDDFGKTYEWKFKLTLMGLHSHEVAQRIVAHYELPLTWQEYAELQKKATKKLMVSAQLLPDTEVIYEQIISQIAQEFQKTYTLEVRSKVLGTTERRTAEIVIAELKLPITADAFLIKFRKLCYEMLGDAKMMPGIARLVRHLHKHKVPIAVATSSSAPLVEVKIEKHAPIFNLMHHMVCGSTDEEVKQGKPAPDIFFVAARRFCDNVDPSCCLVFEDAPNGVTAARSAGMQVIMVPDPNTPRELCKDATQVLNTMEDFRPECFGLPAF